MAINGFLLLAACLSFAVGLIHSVLGEARIFRGLAQDRERGVLKKSHVQILRVTWHIATLFGWALSALLLSYALPGALLEPQALTEFTKATIITVFSLASLLTLIGTRGKHPGWIGLLGVAILVGLG